MGQCIDILISAVFVLCCVAVEYRVEYRGTCNIFAFVVGHECGSYVDGSFEQSPVPGYVCTCFARVIGSLIGLRYKYVASRRQY